jgi:hypothetical protein
LSNQKGGCLCSAAVRRKTRELDKGLQGSGVRPLPSLRSSSASDPLAGERPRRGELDKGLKMNAPIKPHTAAAEIV